MTLLFIVGTGRCGSTMVHEVLARHPDVGFISNADNRLHRLNPRGRANSWLYDRVPGGYTQRHRRHLLGRASSKFMHFGPSEAYHLVARHVSPMLVDPYRDLVAADATPWVAQRCRRFFDDRLRAQGKPVFTHKFAGWPRACFLAEVFPEARFVHVFRDGRAVVNSLVQEQWWTGFRGVPQWGYGQLSDDMVEEWARHDHDFVVLAALWWKRMMAAFDRAGRELGPERWLELRYEDIVASPRQEISKVVAFAGLAWDTGFERRFEQFSFSTSNRERFRKDLTVAQQDAVESVLSGCLRAHGYSLTRGAG